jgi:hypothetical protein
LILTFLTKLVEYLPIKGKVRKPKNRNIWLLRYSHSPAKVILDYMYKDSTIYLERKYERYLKLAT